MLAIDPGARYLGLAVFVESELVRAEVKRLHENGMTVNDSTAKAERILLRWIRRYRPTLIAIEEPYFAQSKASAGLRRVMKAIIRSAKRESLPVCRYLPTAVRRRLDPHGRPTRLGAARVIADRFPWLRPYYEREARRSWWRRHYWLPLFDAIAVGLTCLEEPSKAKTSRHAA